MGLTVSFLGHFSVIVHTSHLPLLPLGFLSGLSWLEINSYGGLGIISLRCREVQNLTLSGQTLPSV